MRAAEWWLALFAAMAVTASCSRAPWVAPAPVIHETPEEGMTRVLARALAERESRFEEALHPGALRSASRARLAGGDLSDYRDEGERLFGLDAPWDPGEDVPPLGPGHARSGPDTTDATRCLACHHVGGEGGSGDFGDLAFFDVVDDDLLSATRRLPRMLAGAGLLERAAAGHKDRHPFGWSPGRPRTLRQMVRWSIDTHLGTAAREEEVDALTTFIALLPPPAPDTPPADSLVLRTAAGAALFLRIGCAECHVESMPVEDPVLVLSGGRRIDLRFLLAPDGRPPFSLRAFTDLRAHGMGAPLARKENRQEADDRFVTPPLWGVASRAPLLHDGRASSLPDAILAHGGEAQKARDAFAALGSERSDLLLFLATLGRPSVMTWIR